MKKAFMVTTTATFANKGKEALKRNGISAQIKKIQGGTAAGCLFALELPLDNLLKAQEILERENIRIILTKEVEA